MKKLEKGSLVVGGLALVGMGAGIGLALGGITETCCIGAITASVPGLVYLASAAVATVAMLAFVFSWIYQYRSGIKKEYSVLNAGIIAISLGAYAITQYCLSLGLIEQAFAAGGVAAVGAAICLGIWNASRARPHDQSPQCFLGKGIAWAGVLSIGIGLITTAAVAASSALPLVLEAGVTAEMMAVAQWLTVEAITIPALVVMASIMQKLEGAGVPGFRDEDYERVGAIFIRDNREGYEKIS